MRHHYTVAIDRYQQDAVLQIPLQSVAYISIRTQFQKQGYHCFQVLNLTCTDLLLAFSPYVLCTLHAVSHASTYLAKEDCIAARGLGVKVTLGRWYPWRDWSCFCVTSRTRQFRDRCGPVSMGACVCRPSHSMWLFNLACCSIMSSVRLRCPSVVLLAVPSLLPSSLSSCLLAAPLVLLESVCLVTHLMTMQQCAVVRARRL